MKKGLVHIILLFIALGVYGQDVHYSQFYSSPTFLNPSETGFFQEDWRVGGHIKQQWPWAQNDKRFTYMTYGFFGDAGLLKGSKLGKDWLGVGGSFLNDYAGDGRLSITKVNLSAAYHKVLGNEGKYSISLGVGGTYVQKGIDYEQLYFDNQWNDLFFDTDVPSREANANENFGYFDLSVGTHFSALFAKKYNVVVGFSMLHLNKPKESFYDAANRLGMRPAVSTRAHLPVGKRLHFEPALLYMSQRKASEIIVSTIAGYRISGDGVLDNIVLLAGVSYRAKDAFVPLLGMEYKRFRILANYDINLSTLTAASNAIGGFEVSLVYKGMRPVNTQKMVVPCPRM